MKCPVKCCQKKVVVINPILFFGPSVGFVDQFFESRRFKSKYLGFGGNYDRARSCLRDSSECEVYGPSPAKIVDFRPPRPASERPFPIGGFLVSDSTAKFNFSAVNPSVCGAELSICLR
jgi:hypothetical protein